MAFEGLINEVDCIDYVEAGLSERADGALISRGRISDDRTHVAVVKMYFVPNSRTTAGPSPRPVISISPIARSIPADIASAPT